MATVAFPERRFEEVFDASASIIGETVLTWDSGMDDEDILNEEGPETYYDDIDEAPELYNAIMALHANKPVAFLLPRRDKAKPTVPPTKKGGRSASRKATGYVEIPTCPAGPAGILTCIDVPTEQQESADPTREEASLGAAGKRRRAAAGPVATSVARNISTAGARKRNRAPGVPADTASVADGGDELGADGQLRATNVHAASMPVVSSLMHLKHVVIEDACTAVGGPMTIPAGSGGMQAAPAGYSGSYGDLYAKLERIETDTTKPNEVYRVFSRLPCALWTDPSSFVGEFVVISRDFPSFNIACATHSQEKAVKWKKSGSPQLRDMGAQTPGVQVMSQFAVARGLTDNSKVYSARVSCAVRMGEAQGVHIVQVRAAGDAGGNGGPMKGSNISSGAAAALSGGRDVTGARASAALLYGPTSASGGLANSSAGSSAALHNPYARFLWQPPYVLPPQLVGGATSANVLSPSALLYQHQQQQALFAGLAAGNSTLLAYSAAMARAHVADAAAAAAAGHQLPPHAVPLTLALPGQPFYDAPGSVGGMEEGASLPEAAPTGADSS